MGDPSKKAEIPGDEEYYEDLVTITRDTDEGICIRVSEERNRLR